MPLERPMARIIVLGGGRQGRIIANDLAGDHDVTVADLATVNLLGVRSMQRDLSRPLELVGTLREYDVVVGALPARARRCRGSRSSPSRAAAMSRPSSPTACARSCPGPTRPSAYHA